MDMDELPGWMDMIHRSPIFKDKTFCLLGPQVSEGGGRTGAEFF
jgi:hypothetical protein